MTWVQTVLDSGERVISEELPHVRSVAIGYWIGVGSRDEDDRRAGISHFIEHLLFKGSARHTALDLAELFDEMGGELNAATSREDTVVYSRIPDNHLEVALSAIGDMVFSPFLSDLDSEREVVLEEIAMYEDSPQELVHDLLGQAIFGGHPLGRPVIGNADVISNVSSGTLRSFHASGYTPDNVVVAAAGNVDHEALVALVEGLARTRTPAADPQVPGGRATRELLEHLPAPGTRFQVKDTEQYHVCLGASGIARSDPRRFAASLLDSILGGSASSRLFQEIREKRGMAYSVYSFSSQFSETGESGLYVGTREENLADALRIAVEQIADIASGNITDAELRRAKQSMEGRMLLGLESTSARMHRLGKSVVSGTEILTPEQVLEKIERVSPEEVAELASTLLGRERLSAAGIGPREDVFRAAIDGALAETPRAA